MYHKPTRVRFGAAYYDEYQRVDRLETDLDLMAEASFSVIRVGESVWSTWEPQNGTFDLEWLLPVLDGAHERRIGVVLGTPTYAVPPWLARIYPEIAGERATGQRISWGARQEVDFTHPAFRYLGPAPQDMYHWIEKVGLTMMKDVMLTMRAVGAEEGERKGLVTKVVPEDELEKWVGDYADAIAVMPLDSLMMGKSMMQVVMEARGKGLGAMTGWVGHGWATNVSFEEGDWNFLKERREKGIAQALADRDRLVAPYFRLSESRSSE